MLLISSNFWILFSLLCKMRCAFSCEDIVIVEPSVVVYMMVIYAIVYASLCGVKTIFNGFHMMALILVWETSWSIKVV